MKVGFIGCGGFSSATHIPNVAKNPAFEIVAFCDLDAQRLASLKDAHKPCYVTQDMADIFRDPSIEMVVCGTKPDARLPIMRQAVTHRKHLFVEKPLCYRNEDIEPMLDIMAGASTLFMVGFNRPYSPIMQDVRPLYRKAKKGSATILYRIIGEAQLWPKHHYDAVVHQRESTLIHEATHIFDLLNWLTGSEPTRVFTAGEGNMDNAVTLSYPDNVTAVVLSGDNSTAAYPKERLEINTNYATIVAENFTHLLAVNVNSQMVRKTYPWKMGNRVYDLSERESLDQAWQWRQSLTPQEIATGYYYDRMPRVDKGHYSELEHFRQAIVRGGPSPTDIYHGAMASLIAAKAVESWEKSLPIAMDFSYLRRKRTAAL